jgi:hypothetical protein
MSRSNENQGGGNQGNGTETQTDPNPTGASHTNPKDKDGSPPKHQPNADAKAQDGRPKAENVFPMTSRKLAGVGRVLHAYSPAWDGPRSAIVSNDFGQAARTRSNVETQRVNANVFADGANDRRLLEYVRRSNSGNTFPSAEVYDALTPEQRAEKLPELKDPASWRASWNGFTAPPVIFEWPPLT